MSKDIIIAVDCDQTLLDSNFPELGPENHGAIDWCKRFQSEGAMLILLTMRAKDSRLGDVLTPAVECFRDNGLVFWGVNENPDQYSWNQSRKVYANLYIDDANVGIALRDGINNQKPMVDWRVVGPQTLDWIHERKISHNG